MQQITMRTIFKTNRALIFDVETTGLLPKKGHQVPIQDYPHITQMSFIVLNLLTKTVELQKNFYINIPNDVEITEKITELTGITKKMCTTLGVSIIYALNEFYQAYNTCDVIVAHNHEFDSEMMKLEIYRNREILQKANETVECLNLFNTVYDNIYNIQHYCTMKSSVAVCDIMIQKPGKNPYKKWPTLCELYKHLFGETPTGLHNSMVDTLVCMRCYLILSFQFYITDAYFEELSKI
jgi:DNA polymerase-3 subunit alpha